MADWEIIASLATSAGTLALALATFSSVRAARRSAEVSERSLLIGTRPLLINSHIYDPAEKISFRGTHWVKLAGGHGHAGATKEAIFFAISVRNVGQGPAVLNRWSFTTDGSAALRLGSTGNYRRLTRDIYVAAGDVGFWQGAIRDNKDPQFKEARSAIAKHAPIYIHVQYSDQEGGQRTVSMFGLTHREKNDWLAAAGRHWRLEGANPRESTEV